MKRIAASSIMFLLFTTVMMPHAQANDADDKAISFDFNEKTISFGNTPSEEAHEVAPEEIPEPTLEPTLEPTPEPTPEPAAEPMR